MTLGLHLLLSILFILIFKSCNNQTKGLLMQANNTSEKPIPVVVNPHPFSFFLNNENLCSSKPDTLIWVHTAAGHQRKRRIIRETWAYPGNFDKHKAALVFFTGMTSDNKTQALLEYETERYEDIIQGTFIDSYRNLTYKAISASKWVERYCKSADIILKADDDVIVDIYLLFRHIHGLRADGRFINNTFLCNVWNNRRPDREEGKWRVTVEEFPDDNYPIYCPGLFLVMTSDIAAKLYNASLFEKYFWIDDVYFTGILGKSIGTEFESFETMFNFGWSGEIVAYMNSLQKDNFIVYHQENPDVMVMVWEYIKANERQRLKYDIQSFV